MIFPFITAEFQALRVKFPYFAGGVVSTAQTPANGNLSANR